MTARSRTPGLGDNRDGPLRARSGVALVGTDCWALLDVNSGDALLEVLWPAMAASRPFAELLDLVLANGLSDLPALALLHWGADLRVVVRGEVVVELGTGNAGVLLAASSLVSWRGNAQSDRPDVTLLALSGSSSDLAMFPTGGRVLLADRALPSGPTAAVIADHRTRADTPGQRARVPYASMGFRAERPMDDLGRP